MWALQLLLLRNGMETIRKFQDWAGPAVWGVMALLVVYILINAGWNISFDLPGGKAEWGVAHAFFAAIALTVTYFSTLMLNFCDFSRFAPSRKAVRTANLWGLPVNFIAFSVVSVVVTAGTFKVYGEHIYDPVEIVGRIDSIWALLLGAVTFAVATLGINVVANFVSPAYDLANAWPSKIDFKRGGSSPP
ncbi:probable allantoin permease [Arthrobacter sp. Hiyo6]|nr:probable allantoin permease [Arthrobacter sp. Hiyo6]